jgi:hypothetical protein
MQDWLVGRKRARCRLRQKALNQVSGLNSTIDGSPHTYDVCISASLARSGNLNLEALNPARLFASAAVRLRFANELLP